MTEYVDKINKKKIGKQICVFRDVNSTARSNEYILETEYKNSKLNDTKSNHQCFRTACKELTLMFYRN